MVDLRYKFDYLFKYIPLTTYFVQILELSVKFASQICHYNTNTPLDGAYLADFGIDIRAIVVVVVTLFKE